MNSYERRIELGKYHREIYGLLEAAVEKGVEANLRTRRTSDCRRGIAKFLEKYQKQLQRRRLADPVAECAGDVEIFGLRQVRHDKYRLCIVCKTGYLQSVLDFAQDWAA